MNSVLGYPKEIVKQSDETWDECMERYDKYLSDYDDYLNTWREQFYNHLKHHKREDNKFENICKYNGFNNMFRRWENLYSYVTIYNLKKE